MGEYDQGPHGRPGNRKEVNIGRRNLRQNADQHPELTNSQTHQSTTTKKHQFRQVELAKKRAIA